MAETKTVPADTEEFHSALDFVCSGQPFDHSAYICLNNIVALRSPGTGRSRGLAAASTAPDPKRSFDPNIFAETPETDRQGVARKITSRSRAPATMR
jgi:hypothetical protein